MIYMPAYILNTSCGIMPMPSDGDWDLLELWLSAFPANNTGLRNCFMGRVCSHLWQEIPVAAQSLFLLILLKRLLLDGGDEDADLPLCAFLTAAHSLPLPTNLRRDLSDCFHKQAC